MASFKYNLWKGAVLAVVAGLVAPQVLMAGHGGGGHGGGFGGGHGGSFGGSHGGSGMRSGNVSRSMPSSRPSQNFQSSNSQGFNKQFTQGQGSKSGAFKNGNTGINGSGMPKTGVNNGKGAPGTNKGNGGVIAAKNGNTGINGTGLPKSNGGLGGTGKGGVGNPGKGGAGGMAGTGGGKGNGGGMGQGGGKGQGNGKGPGGMANHHHHHHHHGFFPVLFPLPWYPGGGVVYSDPGYVNYGGGGYVGQPLTPGVNQYADVPPVDGQQVAYQSTEPDPAQFADSQAVSTQSGEILTSGDIDLAVENVELVEAASAAAGPTFKVTIRNDGTQTASNFRVGAFGEIDGKLSDDAPRTVVDVASLPAGESRELTLELPAPTMRLVSTSSTGNITFTQLLVAVDLDDSVPEVDKANNISVVERDAMETVAH